MYLRFTYINTCIYLPLIFLHLRILGCIYFIRCAKIHFLTIISVFFEFLVLGIHNYFDIKILHLVELENFNLFGLALTNLIPNYTIHLLTTPVASSPFFVNFCYTYIHYSYQECSKFYPKSCALQWL